MTSFQRKALETIFNHPGITAKQFALFMWPDSNMHTKTSNQGNGACHGKAAWLCGGSHLGKLRAKGLIKHDIINGGDKLTEKGLELIR